MSEPEPGSAGDSEDPAEESRFPLFSVALSIILLMLLAGTLTVVSQCRSGSCTGLGQVAALATVASIILIIATLILRPRQSN